MFHRWAMKIFCLTPQELLMLQQFHFDIILCTWVYCCSECVCVCVRPCDLHDDVIRLCMGIGPQLPKGKKAKNECLSGVTWHVSIPPDYYSHFLFDFICNCVKAPAYVTAQPTSPTPKTTRPECSCKAGALIWCSVENGWLFHSNTEGPDLPMKKWLCIT